MSLELQFLYFVVIGDNIDNLNTSVNEKTLESSPI